MNRTNWLKNKLSAIILITFVLTAFAGCGSGGGALSGTTTGTTGGGSTGGGSRTSVSLNWDAPTQNADGSPISNLAGYKVYYGTFSGLYANSIDVGNTTSATINSLTPGSTYYFAVSAYNTALVESTLSNELSQLM